MSSVHSSLLLRETGQLSSAKFASLHGYQNLNSLNAKSFCQQRFAGCLIMEIIPTPNLIFAITSAWKCLCIHKATFEFLFELTLLEERSRTLCYNHFRNSIILVMMQEVQGEERLMCKVFELNDLEKNKVQGTELFSLEDLRLPGFLEFDENNRLIMTRSASTQEFKFWSLEDYSNVFTVNDPFVEEVRVTTDMCLLVYQPQENSLKCKLCSIKNGSTLDIFEIAIKAHKVIELLELFAEHFLIKQYGEPLLMFNLLTHSKISIPGFVSPQNFIYLYEKNLFLSLRNSVIEVWNFNGKLLKIYNAPVYSSNGGFIPNRVFISKAQDMIMLSCIERTRQLGRTISDPLYKTSIKIFKLSEGILIKEIKESELLSNISTLIYDEHFGNIYTGHADGSITWFTN